MRALLFLVRLGIVAALVVGGGAFWFYKEISRTGNGGSKPIVFEVEPGVSGRDIADSLEKKGLIANATAFRWLLRVKEKREGVTLRAGHFEVDPRQDAKDVLDSLLYGDTLTRKATVPEGFTMEQTANSLAKQKICSAEDFWKVANSDSLELGWEFPKELEGYLFPSTYEFPWECTGEQAVLQMTGQFRASVEPLWKKYKSTAPLTFRETIVLASLVEREAQVASERPTIAGVYVNRLRKGMKLECDATVQFALGEQKAVLLYRDLEIASPYNTYRYEGLPPGPICSPGLDAIRAAMNPKKSDYLFYVRNDVKNDGSHVFGRDFYEHEQNIAKYQR